MKFKDMKSKITNFSRNGQIMIMSILTLGAVMLGATAVSGLLVIYQIRMSADASNSAKAIFAADAGIDWGIYRLSKPTSTVSAPVFSNGASFTLICLDSSSNIVDCGNPSVSVIRSSGKSVMSNRAFELSL